MPWGACPSLAKVLLLSPHPNVASPFYQYMQRGGGSCCTEDGGPDAPSLSQVFSFTQRIVCICLWCQRPMYMSSPSHRVKVL